AEIMAEVRTIADCGLRNADLMRQTEVVIRGGKGVGTVTKPGLAIPVGEPAINPVPRKMILASVLEALSEFAVNNPQPAIRNPQLEVIISVPQGEALAKKTLNHRLGIIGGISILGTTGIVKPLSDAAWTATIAASFDVAKALGLTEVVLSTGRTSEKAHQQKYGLPEEAYAMMGDYTEFSLREAKKRGFRKIHLCAQWAKMIKIAMATPQTHVRHGALEAEAAAEFLRQLGIDIPKTKTYNTSREIYEYIIYTFSPRERTSASSVETDRVRVGPQEGRQNPSPPDLPLKGRLDVAAFIAICGAAKAYCERLTEGTPVSVHLVSYEGEIVAESA
ncbi:MAG TPA: cobalt-precorrin-5B (C(1))-methyltransferase CbiD, partial [Nitrospirota bacterium]|nr:cobalt-precorrin-5B (C(1))-methyltransferase CbiD [Nitrospirota bacterium]